MSKFVDEYADSEVADFESDLKRRRRLAVPVLLYGAALAAGFFLSLLFGDTLLFIVLHGFAGLGFALFFGNIGYPQCPACKNQINQLVAIARSVDRPISIAMNAC